MAVAAAVAAVALTAVVVTVKIIDFDGTRRDDDYFSFFSAIFRSPAAAVSLLYYVFLSRDRFPILYKGGGKKKVAIKVSLVDILYTRTRDVIDVRFA